MIKLIQVPTVAMDVIIYTGTITSPETTESATQWILKDAKKERKKGTIEIEFFNNASREHIEIQYSRDNLLGKIPDGISKYSVVDIRAEHWGRTGNFNYEVSIMDPESKEYSGLRSDDDEEEWEE